jgi:hypothetical protein
MVKVLHIHVWKWNNETCWNYSKKRGGEVKEKEEVNLSYTVNTFVNVTMYTWYKYNMLIIFFKKQIFKNIQERKKEKKKKKRREHSRSLGHHLMNKYLHLWMTQYVSQFSITVKNTWEKQFKGIKIYFGSQF